MKSNSFVIKGNRIIRENGQPGTLFLVDAIRQEFECDPDTHGNFFTPNAQNYFKRYRQWYIGSDIYIDDNSSSEVLGVQQYTPTDIHDVGYSVNTVNKCIDKLNEAVRGTLDLSIDVAESHQTVNMIRDCYKVLSRSSYYLYRMYSQLRRGNPTALADLWLQYQYGVKPLMSDVYDTMKRVMHPENAYRTIRVRASDKQEYVDKYSFGTIGDGEAIETVKTFISNRCEIKCDINTSQDSLASLAGYTSLNPVSIVWELVPYSFVVDWVIDVGGYLRGLETAATFNQSFIRGYQTESVKSRVTGTIDGSGKYPTAHGRRSVSFTSGMVEKTFKKRRVLLDYPVPRFPQVKPSLGPQRLISAASLLSQFVKSWR